MFKCVFKFGMVFCLSFMYFALGSFKFIVCVQVTNKHDIGKSDSTNRN